MVSIHAGVLACDATYQNLLLDDINMKQIRQGVFETNSSSTHSITIAKDGEGLMQSWIPDDNGNITVVNDDFGWEEADYTDPSIKASYLSIYVRDWIRTKDHNKNGSKIVDIETRNKFKQILIDVIQTQTGAKNVELAWGEEGMGGYYGFNGYIDHQSVENRDYDYLFEDPELIRQFIFNSNSVLHTGNDNH